MFRHLHVSPDLVERFLAAFSRMEYALKAAGYLQKTDDARPDWDRFAADVNVEFEQIRDNEFMTAADFLTREPPRKQVVQKGKAVFADRPGNEPKGARSALLMVRRIRNNLVHGGKYSPAGEKEEGGKASI